MNFFLVFLGGGAGSLLRYLIRLWLPWQGGFPWGTLVANILAAAILGIILRFAPDHKSSLLIITGLCGGLSTFSTFSLESAELLRDHQWGFFLLNIILSSSLCIAAVFLLIRQP